MLAKLRRAPVLSKLDLLLTLLPALGWALAVESRSTIISPRCIVHPETCTQQSVLGWDRWTLGFGYGQAEEISLATQYIAGIIALGVPLGLALAARKKKFGMQFGTGLTLMIQTIVWNGLINEIARLIVERPRPFVYLNPAANGTDPAHYTSFYSGHTSFVTAVSLGAIFLLMGGAAPKRVTHFMIGFCSALILTTATSRVLAGKHFPTDVISAMLAASLIALLVAQAHRPSRSWP